MGKNIDISKDIEKELIKRLKKILGKEIKEYVRKDELVRILKRQIDEIRQKNNKDTIQLYQDVESLKVLAEKLSSATEKTKLNDTFNVYEQIIAVSIDLRKILGKVLGNIEQYDNINYALFYKGERYYTKTLNKDWLKLKDDGSLQIKMDKATADLKKIYNQKITEEVMSLVRIHYENYWQALTNMSNFKYKRNFGFNRGHAAEAYEEHLFEDHRKMYDLITNIDNIDGENNEKKSIIENFKEAIKKGPEEWSLHEAGNPDGATRAWLHLRRALGSQRGTVAGDIGKVQVKSGFDWYNWKTKTEETPVLQLASIKNLLDGIEIYTSIFSDKSSSSVASKLAEYLSEELKATPDKVIATMGEDIANEMNIKELNEVTEQLRNLGIVYMHI